jgi:hypothetical protein
MVKMKDSFQGRELAMAQLELAKLTKHYAQSNAAEGKATRTIEGYRFCFSPDIQAQLKILAGELQVPIFSVAEYCLQVGAGLITN